MITLPARIRDDDINEVRERTSIVDVISGYIALKKAGRSHKGLCPFHKEKTPSFMVDAERQLWHCFGCGEGGNVFSFLMKIDNVDFPEAVRILADKAGYTLRFEGADASSAKTARDERDRLIDAVELACDYYQFVLTRTEAASDARQYLQRRGIDSQGASLFRIGFSPSRWDGLLQWLTKKGYAPEELIKAGLALRGEMRQGSIYDRFRNRIMFPIRGLSGQVVGFGGRVIDSGEPKYLNSPDSELFHKSRLLYGLFEHRQAISAAGEAVVVEGYTDVIIPHLRGLDNFVATLGTAFGESHFRLLGRYCKRVVMLFDGDEAGFAAAQRALDFIEDSTAEILVAVMPEGDDPADHVLKSGSDSLTEIVSAAVPIVDYCIAVAESKHDIKTSAGKLKALGEIVAIIARLNSPLAVDEYSRMVSQRFDISLTAVVQEVVKRKHGQKTPAGQQENIAWQAGSNAELAILRAVVQHPGSARQFAETLQAIPDLSDTEAGGALLILAKLLDDNPQASSSQLYDLLRDAGASVDLLKAIVVPVELQSPGEYITSLLRRIRSEAIERQIKALRQRLVDADPDSEGYDEIFHELVELEGIKRST